MEAFAAVKGIMASSGEKNDRAANPSTAPIQSGCVAAILNVRSSLEICYENAARTLSRHFFNGPAKSNLHVIATAHPHYLSELGGKHAGERMCGCALCD